VNAKSVSFGLSDHVFADIVTLLVLFGWTLHALYDRDPVAFKMYGFLLLWIAIMRPAIW